MAVTTDWFAENEQRLKNYRKALAAIVADFEVCCSGDPIAYDGYQEAVATLENNMDT